MLRKPNRVYELAALLPYIEAFGLDNVVPLGVASELGVRYCQVFGTPAPGFPDEFNLASVCNFAAFTDFELSFSDGGPTLVNYGGVVPSTCVPGHAGRLEQQPARSLHLQSARWEEHVGLDEVRVQRGDGLGGDPVRHDALPRRRDQGSAPVPGHGPPGLVVRVVVVAAVAAVGLLGLVSPAVAATDPRVPALQRRVTALEKQVATLLRTNRLLIDAVNANFAGDACAAAATADAFQVTWSAVDQLAQAAQAAPFFGAQTTVDDLRSCSEVGVARLGASPPSLVPFGSLIRFAAGR